MKYPTPDFERRKQARFEKLDTDKPICAICGDKNWWRIERHHIEGQNRGESLTLLCANCHRDVTEDQKDYTPLIPQPIRCWTGLDTFS